VLFMFVTFICQHVIVNQVDSKVQEASYIY
jgi:hypothetical protein